MRSNSELIEISKTFDTSFKMFSFYEFAVSYISNVKSKGITDTDSFYSAIKKLGDHSDERANFSAFGKQSVHSGDEIKQWCKMILSKRESLSELDINELQYVMGYCSRLAKIAELN